MTTSEIRVVQRAVREAVELLESGYVPEVPMPSVGADSSQRVTLTAYDRRVYDALLAAQRVLGPDREYQSNWPRVARMPVDTLGRAELTTWFTHTFRGERFADGLIATAIRDGSLLAAFKVLLTIDE